MKLQNIRKGFETFECKVEQFVRDQTDSNANCNIRKGFETFKCKFEPFESDQKDSNANSNHSKGS